MVSFPGEVKMIGSIKALQFVKVPTQMKYASGSRQKHIEH